MESRYEKNRFSRRKPRGIGLEFASMATMSYECWAYVGGHPDKMVHVSANNASEAESLARDKFKDLGIKAESVHCK